MLLLLLLLSVWKYKVVTCRYKPLTLFPLAPLFKTASCLLPQSVIHPVSRPQVRSWTRPFYQDEGGGCCSDFYFVFYILPFTNFITYWQHLYIWKHLYHVAFVLWFSPCLIMLCWTFRAFIRFILILSINDSYTNASLSVAVAEAIIHIAVPVCSLCAWHVPPRATRVVCLLSDSDWTSCLVIHMESHFTFHWSHWGLVSLAVTFLARARYLQRSRGRGPRGWLCGLINSIANHSFH